MKYITAGISFLFIFFGVAIIVGIVMVMVFPSEQERVLVGVGTNGRNLPGTILGFLAGIQSWRVSIRKAEEKNLKRNRMYNPA
jgi:hypothetical protein